MIRFRVRVAGAPVLISLDAAGASDPADLVYEGDELGVSITRERLEHALGRGGVLIGDHASAEDVYLALFGPDADETFDPEVLEGGELLGHSGEKP